MKAISLKRVMSLMTSLSKRNQLRHEKQATDSETLPEPLPKETVEGLVKMMRFTRMEVELYNRHALPEKQIDITELFASDGEVVKFPELLNSYGLSNLVKEAIEKRYVVNDKKLWSNFLYQWSSKSKKKLNALRWLSISNPMSKCF